MGLSKEILLTVKDYEVKLNKDIKFYENDTIDLCFSILEYGIEVKNGMAVNKLMPINALKAYMLIETPQGVDYAESTKVEDNRVVFNLGDKYSQFVGIGKMQIVIKDNDGCRITLPEFPFEIRQSINSDWDRNITVLSTETSEIIVDEFGREIALKKISEMEEANILPIDSYSMILDNNENKKIKTNLITQKIENDLRLVNEQLDNKANEVDLIVERNRIDLLTKIENGETDGNTELLDIRNGSDGIHYVSAGESVRSQFRNMANNFSKGYVEKVTTIDEAQTINCWIWSNTSGYWTEDNSTSITKKYLLEKGKKYVISGNTANTKVIYGFSDSDYKTGLFMEFPQKIDGGTFNFEFTAQRKYIYVYYSKTTNSTDTISCIKKENDYLEFINLINDDMYKYDTNEYSTSFTTSSDDTKIIIKNIRLIKGHEYEITVSADTNLNQTKLEIGCGLFNKAFNKNNFDLSKGINFSFISTETNKNLSLWIYLKNHLNDINVNVTLKDITGMKKVNNNIALSFSNGAFNGGSIDYDTTKMIRTSNIFMKKECIYLVTYPTNIYSVYNIKNSSGSLENHETYGSFSVKGNDDFLRLSFARIDCTDLNISNFDTSQIKVLEVYSNNKNYDITVSAPDSHIGLKEKSDLILKGTDLTYDTRLIQAIIGCDTSIDVLFYNGTYKLNEIHKTKYGQYGILTTNEWIANTSKMINIYGYQNSVFAKPPVDFQVTESLHNSLNSSNENAIFLVPKPESGNVTGTCMTLKGLTIQNYDIDKAIVGIDFSNVGATTIEDTIVKVQKYPGYTKFTQEPNKGLVGIRVGYGSNYGIRNIIKHVSVRHHYIGHSCVGEHFIYEDVKAHDCMIGFAFGDKYTQPKMEHPNMMIGCSIEQCARLMLLSRYGETVENSVESGEVTLVCTGLSTETWFKGIGDEEGYNTLPIKETIKGLYRGKIEGDYREKGISFFENDGSGKNMTQLVY